MSDELRYGPRLSDEEYDRKIVELYSGQPEGVSKPQDESRRRQELELTIDYRLGRDFPRARRDALWEVQQRVEGKRARLFLHYLLRRLRPRALASKSQRLAGFLVDEYAKVLDADDLVTFFGEDEVRAPSLPLPIESEDQ